MEYFLYDLLSLLILLIIFGGIGYSIYTYFKLKHKKIIRKNNDLDKNLINIKFLSQYLDNITKESDQIKIKSTIFLFIKNNETVNENDLIRHSHQKIMNSYSRRNNIKLFFGVIFSLFLITIIIGVPLIISYVNTKKTMDTLRHNYTMLSQKKEMKEDEIKNQVKSTSKSRLKELNDLYKENLISLEDYNKRKEEILKDI